MLNRVYELETDIFRSSQRETELKEAVKQARFDLRQATIAQVEYSGIRAFLDKLSGKYADKAEEFSREVRKAEAELGILERQLEAENQKLSALKNQRASLPSLEQLRTPENEDLWNSLECHRCARQLLPKLEALEEALEEYRQMLRGEIPLLSISQQQAIGAAPISLGEACSPLLARLEPMGISYGDFFRSPAAFLAAAARHNQLERAAAADTQLRKLKAELLGLLQGAAAPVRQTTI